MPLDTRKITHVQSVVARTYTSRTKTMVFVRQTSGGGSYSYTATTVIFKPLKIVDPQIPDDQGNPPMQVADAVIICPLTVSFTGVVFIADTTTATSGGAAAATKYEVIDSIPVGIIPGGTHYEVSLRRMR